MKRWSRVAAQIEPGDNNCPHLLENRREESLYLASRIDPFRRVEFCGTCYETIAVTTEVEVKENG